MAWKQGFFYLAPGASTLVKYFWGGQPYGVYEGVQYAQARPWTATTLAKYEVMTSEQRLSYQAHKTNFGIMDDWNYSALVTNTGPTPTWFVLTGADLGVI